MLYLVAANLPNVRTSQILNFLSGWELAECPENLDCCRKLFDGQKKFRIDRKWGRPFSENCNFHNPEGGLARGQVLRKMAHLKNSVVVGNSGKKINISKSGIFEKSVVVRISGKTFKVQKNVNIDKKNGAFEKFGGSRTFRKTLIIRKTSLIKNGNLKN